MVFSHTDMAKLVAKDYHIATQPFQRTGENALVNGWLFVQSPFCMAAVVNAFFIAVPFQITIRLPAAIQFLLIFLVGWDIWSDREADFGKSRKPTMQPIITGMNWNLNFIPMQVHSKLRCIT